MAERRNPLISADEIRHNWIRKELVFDKQYRRGDKGRKVRVIQEWLSLHGHGIGIDGDFGKITEKAVSQFQEAQNLSVNGRVDELTFQTLLRPMLRALTPLLVRSRTYNDLIVAYARQHLAEHPREMGGENCGPWVRLYMKGNDGKDWLWCAGFVCFILQQAADATGNPTPLKASFSCDTLAERARNKGIFVSESNLNRGHPSRAAMPAGSVFLSRRTSSDWTHTGLVTKFEEDGYETIEGNTNDEGSREGYEVCKRIRGYRKKDFIRIGDLVA